MRSSSLYEKIDDIYGIAAYLTEKYSSIHTAIATIRIRLRIFPTPRYIRIAKRDEAIEIISPRRELANIKEKVKSNATKKVTKNKGTAPKVLGSTK